LYVLKTKLHLRCCGVGASWVVLSTQQSQRLRYIGQQLWQPAPQHLSWQHRSTSISDVCVVLWEQCNVDKVLRCSAQGTWRDAAGWVCVCMCMLQQGLVCTANYVPFPQRSVCGVVTVVAAFQLLPNSPCTCAFCVQMCWHNVASPACIRCCCGCCNAAAAAGW
jgi:hypothetical protein